jgi:hypothetical protein
MHGTRCCWRRLAGGVTGQPSRRCSLIRLGITETLAGGFCSICFDAPLVYFVLEIKLKTAVSLDKFQQWLVGCNVPHSAQPTQEFKFNRFYLRYSTYANILRHWHTPPTWLVQSVKIYSWLGSNSGVCITCMINIIIVLLKIFFDLQRLWNVEWGGNMITNVDLSVLKQLVVAQFKVFVSFCFGSAVSEVPITSFCIYLFTLLWVFLVRSAYNNNKNNFCSLNSSLGWYINLYFRIHTTEHIIQNFTNVKFRTNILKRWQPMY